MVKSLQTRNAEKLRTLINRAIRENALILYHLEGGRRNALFFADYPAHTIVPDAAFRDAGLLEILYTPDVFNQFKDEIILDGQHLNVSNRVYKSTIRKLSEWEIMKKLES